MQKFEKWNDDWLLRGEEDFTVMAVSIHLMWYALQAYSDCTKDRFDRGQHGGYVYMQHSTLPILT